MYRRHSATVPGISTKLTGHLRTGWGNTRCEFRVIGRRSFCVAAVQRSICGTRCVQHRKNQPCIERRPKIIKATAMKLGDDVGRMRGYIAGKFHRNRSSSFCLAVQ